jgi:hypothetical protein
MVKLTEKDIFDKYNPSNEIVRCPNGKSSLRKNLNLYAVSSVNLYGVIQKEELIKLYNEQNEEKANIDDLYILLLPLIIKNRKYVFYKDYLINKVFINDYKNVEKLIEIQSKKPRYIPDKEEFLKYNNEKYIEHDYWYDVFVFMIQIFGYSDNTMKGFKNVKDYITYGFGISELGTILNDLNLLFSEIEQLNEFFRKTMLAKNNSREWFNNGYSPVELQEITKKNNNIIELPKMYKTKVGRNDPCPCGSGLKYKKCCALFDDSKSAQLSNEEKTLFYETWIGLISFVNEEMKVIKQKIKPEHPTNVSELLIHKVREVLWQNPELITKYINTTILTNEKKEILNSWINNHIKDSFIVFEYRNEYAVLISSNDLGQDVIYGVKGISGSISSTLNQKIPLFINTVLLPFKGKIIYDSFISSNPIAFGDGAIKSFKESYNRALNFGIITNLEI